MLFESQIRSLFALWKSLVFTSPPKFNFYLFLSFRLPSHPTFHRLSPSYLCYFSLILYLGLLGLLTSHPRHFSIFLSSNLSSFSLLFALLFALLFTNCFLFHLFKSILPSNLAPTPITFFQTFIFPLNGLKEKRRQKITVNKCRHTFPKVVQPLKHCLHCVLFDNSNPTARFPIHIFLMKHCFYFQS